MADDRDLEKEEGAEDGEEARPIKSGLNTIREYNRSYATALEGNDMKAVRLFRQYEAQEKLRRLQNELMMVKADKVDEKACDAVIGKKRKVKYKGYSAWASLMLQWIASAKR